MLLRMIEGDDVAAEAHIFSNELIVRGSTGPAPHRPRKEASKPSPPERETTAEDCISRLTLPP